MRCRKRPTLALLSCVLLSLGGATNAADTNLQRVSRDRLCVTEGAIEEEPGQRLSVSVPKMRANVEQQTMPAAEARFRYLGSTGNEARLGSGESRRQFGLKLRAQDACNLVYAMWRIEPESKLVVSKPIPVNTLAPNVAIAVIATSNHAASNRFRNFVPAKLTRFAQT
jgi:hypothetical protein